MKFDWTWVKITAISAVQHAAAVALAAVGADAANVWSVDWIHTAELAGGTALVSVLAAVVAYPIPGIKSTLAISVPTGAVQAVQAIIQARPLVGDAGEARRT